MINIETKIENAQIEATYLGEIHDCLTANLIIKGQNWEIAFGGFSLDYWYVKAGSHKSSDGYGAIIELMKTLEVNNWEALKGQYVRVESEPNNGKVIRIGHLSKDQWFSFAEYFDVVKSKK